MTPTVELDSFAQLMTRAIAATKPYRIVVQQATCRACGNVHERELGLMLEHAPGSFIKVTDPLALAANESAPVLFQPVALAWCEACHSAAAQELTREVRAALDSYPNTISLAKALRLALATFDRAHIKEKFHHGQSSAG